MRFSVIKIKIFAYSKQGQKIVEIGPVFKNRPTINQEQIFDKWLKKDNIFMISLQYNIHSFKFVLNLY